MSDLREMTESLISQSLVTRPSIAALRRRNQRRRRRRLSGIFSALVVVVAAAFGLAQISGPSGSSKGGAGARLAAYFQASVNIPDTTLAAVGVPGSIQPPTIVTSLAATAPTQHVVSYVGAEYCPYCAIQRWALLVALSKFGAFESLNNSVYSSSNDAFPNLASWSFVSSRYSSQYFNFDPTELTSSVPDGHGGYQPLETMDAGQKVSFNQYDPQGSLPFIDMGNGVVAVGASSSPSVLEGLSLSQIGSDIQDPASPVAQAVDGTANYIIAGLCSMISGSQPAICNSPTVAIARSYINVGHSSAGGSSDLAPTQPATTASLATWQQWSDAMHAYLVRQLPLLAKMTTPGCITLSIEVIATVYTKTTLGIPPGIKTWGVGGKGQCSSTKTPTNGK
jgi:hypothetical protein